METNNSKTTQQRVLIGKNFKNIGVSKLDNETYKLSEKQEELLLNVNYKGDKAGGLVIIIGENNTGKSNVRSALAKFMYEFDSVNPFSSNDIPNYIGYESCEPSLELILKDYKIRGGGGKICLHHSCQYKERRGKNII